MEMAATRSKVGLQRACPVCRNAARAEILHTQKFVLPEDHILPREYDLVSCAECGCVYADTPANQRVYDQYYADMSLYEGTYIHVNAALFADRANWIASFFSQTDVGIVDVGCGNGQLLAELSKRGFSNLTAIDPSQKCIDAIRNSGMEGIVGSILGVRWPKTFDAVVLSGVLEHIRDVPRMMETIRALATPRGLLFVVVPDAARYQDYDAVPYDYLNIEHLNHFDETSLLNLGLQHGFRTLQLQKTTITLASAVQPVLHCVYEKQDAKAIPWRDYSAQCLRQYLAVTGRNEVGRKQIDQFVESQEEIVVWGAGNYTARALAATNLGKCRIAMFVDNDRHKQGTRLHGRPVNGPDAITRMETRMPILIVSAVYYDDILRQIEEMCLENRVIVLK